MKLCFRLALVTVTLNFAFGAIESNVSAPDAASVGLAPSQHASAPAEPASSPSEPPAEAAKVSTSSEPANVVSAAPEPEASVSVPSDTAEESVETPQVEAAYPQQDKVHVPAHSVSESESNEASLDASGGDKPRCQDDIPVASSHKHTGCCSHKRVEPGVNLDGAGRQHLAVSRHHTNSGEVKVDETLAELQDMQEISQTVSHKVEALSDDFTVNGVRSSGIQGVVLSLLIVVSLVNVLG